MKGNVLVIGSAHLDILADYTDDTKNNIDKIGSIKIALGGSAYNIAINLGLHNYNVSILTILKTGSLSGKLIKDSLEGKGVNTDYISYCDFISESGFVAQRLSGKLESAVSSSTIDQVVLNEGKLKESIKKSSAVVLDCNLSKEQILQIINIAKKYNIPLMVSSVSESKVNRAIYIKTEYSLNYLLFSTNSVEAKKYFEWDTKIDKNEIIDFCNFYKSEFVVVTNGKNGYSIFEHKGNRFDFKAPQVPIIKSELGAGDALLAAICGHYAENNMFNWDNCQDVISRFLKPVLSVEEATVGACEAPKDIIQGIVPNSIFGIPKKMNEKFDVFVLIPFSEPFLFVFEEHIKPTLSKVGLSCGTAMDIYGNSAIIDDIWSSIYNSKVIIADYSGRNPNVFYEIGIAHTLGKETILITQSLTDIPFDLRHLRAIEYKYTPKDMHNFEDKLSKSIKSIFAK